MNLSYYLNQVAATERDIADLQKKIGEESKKELDKQKQISSVEKSISKNISASSLQSKQRQIFSYKDEILRINTKKADLQKKLAIKTKELATRKQRLLQEEEKERKKSQQEQTNLIHQQNINFNRIEAQVVKIANNVNNKIMNKIELSSRRNILDAFVVSRISWSGNLDQVNFLGRLFDLSKLPSDDYRYKTAGEDIYKHTVLNNDWPEEWVFTDRRFNLLHVDDKLFLEFLCLTIHPAVRDNQDQIVTLQEIYNNNLSKYGFEIYKKHELDGLPVFDFREINKVVVPAAVKTVKELKLALVIGCSNYVHSGILANPINDANAIEVKLQELGFDVIKLVDPGQKEMKISIDEFGEKLKGYNTGMFYFAGHGVQVKGMNYLIPIDANLKTEKMVEYDCVEVGRVLAYMEDSKADVNIVVLDACRDNPFERSWGRGIQQRGLTTMDAPSGSLIAYATSPGKTASDGEGGNGLYTGSLLQYIDGKQVNVMTMFQQVRSEVRGKSNGMQTPWEATSLTADYFFNP